MSQLFKGMFEMLINDFNVCSNLLINYFIMGIIGLIAFKIAFTIVGIMGARGDIGSLFHWTIRFIIYFLLYKIVHVIIKTYKFWIALSHINKGIIVMIICIIPITFLLIKNRQNHNVAKIS